MMDLIGAHAVNLDVKGRLGIPKKYRTPIEEEAITLVVTIDTDDPCLLVYPQPEWEPIKRQLKALPVMDPQARRLQRLLLSHAHELELDSQGRVLLPQMLRDYAGLEKSVMLVGQGNKFECWDHDAWIAQRDQWLKEAAEFKQTQQVSSSLSQLVL